MAASTGVLPLLHSVSSNVTAAISSLSWCVSRELGSIVDSRRLLVDELAFPASNLPCPEADHKGKMTLSRLSRCVCPIIDTPMRERASSTPSEVLLGETFGENVGESFQRCMLRTLCKSLALCIDLAVRTQCRAKLLSRGSMNLIRFQCLFLTREEDYVRQE